MAHSARGQLGRLIYDGLMGRTLKQLFAQLAKRFEAAGQTLSFEAFMSWVDGVRFPANRARQELLAEVVGGACGAAIRKLPSPAFRGWRRRIMKETEGHMPHHNATRSSGQQRLFPHISVKGEDGRTHQRPVIICTECGTREVVIRNGTAEAAELFAKKGWEVGKNEQHDYCPMCVRARDKPAKVIKMEDHVKKTETPAEPFAPETMSKEEGRILSRMIDDHWDAVTIRYAPGWSDTKMAEHAGKPVECVRFIRERDFGGTGDDPDMVAFVEGQVKANIELEALKAMMGELESAISSLGSGYEHAQRTLDKYRDAHNALHNKVKRLSEIAEKMPPFKAAS